MNKKENLLKVQRQSQIRRTVEERGQVTVTDLSVFYDVSEATIRRDLEELADNKWVRRTHGGAVRVVRALKEPPIVERVNKNEDEKVRIGKRAAQLIREGETVFLGSGTTVHQIACHLPYEISLTVITNSLLVINEIVNHPNIELIVIGGMLRRSELSMVGHIANQAVCEFRADRVFMGIRAIDVNHGFTNDYLPEAVVDREILKIAPEIVVVADHTKFSKVSSVFVAAANAIDLIITDTNTPEEIVSTFGEMMIKVDRV